MSRAPAEPRGESSRRDADGEIGRDAGDVVAAPDEPPSNRRSADPELRTRRSMRADAGAAGDDLGPDQHAPADDRAVVEGPIVAPETVAGRSLTAVVAIMTFLCALLVGGAVLVNRAAQAWSVDVVDELTVTVLPLDGDPVERRLEAVAAAMGAAAGIADVVVVPATRSEALLRPWLGEGIDLSLLPVPRLVTARRSGEFDAPALRSAVEAVPGATLDDHAAWSERLWRMASAAAFAALGALALMFVATAISIVFATRSAIASNAATVEVLDILGADDRFVAKTFRRRFLAIGGRGAAAGALVAYGLFGALDIYVAIGGSGSAQTRAMFGEPSIGLFGYGAIAAVALGVTVLVALTSTLSVRRSLAALHG